MIVEKGVDALTAGVETEPRERVIALKGVPWCDSGVEMRGEAQEGERVRWRRGE